MGPVCVSGCVHVYFDTGLDGDRFTAASAGRQKNCRCGALQLEASSNEGVFSGSQSAFSRIFERVQMIVLDLPTTDGCLYTAAAVCSLRVRFYMETLILMRMPYGPYLQLWLTHISPVAVSEPL